MRLRRKAFSSGGFAFAQTISTQISSYNLVTAATAAGWDGVAPLTATITITAAGSVVGANGVGGMAFDVPTLPVGSLVTVINDGYIAGGGGSGGAGGPYNGTASNGSQGGTALRTRAPLVIKGAGTVAGGGGGGGGGSGIYITSGTGTASSMGGRGADGGRWPASTYAPGAVPGYVSSGDASCKGGDGGGGAPPGFQGGVGGTGTPAGSYTSVTNGVGGQGGVTGHAVDGMDFVTNGSTCRFVGTAVYTANSYIGTPAATPAAGEAFEGGYYVGGLMWGQVAQSDSPLLIDGGTFTFKVPGGAPMFYSNQVVELRSRSNPANYMRGNVRGAANGNVSIFVGGIRAGTGTFSDWSIMAQYRLVVAPKIGGETSLALALGALPADCWTLTEGYSATQAMRNAGDATQYPAAHWAAGLSIGGYTDWYVPARDELERIWRYLKPASVNNYVTADRPTSPTLSYQNNGSKGDTSASHGVNVNALANTGAYIAGNPSQTGVAAFSAGGAQAMGYGSAVYASSTGYDAANAWAQSYQTATQGRQVAQAKETVALIRAMRRSVI